MKATNIKEMIQTLNRKGNLGAQFLRTENISNYASGDITAMNDENLEEKIIRMHEGGKPLSSIFSTSLFSVRFGKTCQTQLNEWPKGNIPRRWTMEAVLPVMSQ